MTKVAKAVAAQEPDLAAMAKLVKIPPANVFEDHSGHFRRHMVVRLPRDVLLDDIRERRVWGAVQASRKALRIHDGLFILAFDESWAAEALVIEADATGATIHPHRIVSYPPKPALMVTEDFSVTWEGTGYAVRRKADNQLMTAPVASQDMAIRDLKNLYVKPV